MKLNKNLTMTAMAALMAVGTVATPVTTFAAGNTGNTQVNVSADDSNLTVTVPTVIPFSMAADGTLTSSELGSIKNGSNFAIHVKSVKVAANAGAFNVVADAAIATEENAVSFQFGKAGNLMNANAPVPTVGQYNMAPAGSAGADIAIVANGKAKNIKADISSAQKVADITWTFAAGNAK